MNRSDTQNPRRRSPDSSPASADRDWRRLVGIGEVHLGADNMVSALEYFERALAIARDLHAPAADVLDIEIEIIAVLHRRGQNQEALAFAEGVLDALPADAASRDRARVLARLGAILGALHRYDEAQSRCEAAYEVLKNTDAHQEVASLQLVLGVIAHRRGDLPLGRLHYENALSTFRRIDDSEGIARALNNLGTLLLTTPRWREGKEYLTRAISVAEESGNYARIASLCLNLGILSYLSGDWQLASTYLSRSLAISKETAPARMIKVHIALGQMKLRKREFAAAESHFLQILDSARELEYPREEALALEFLGDRALREGELDRAEQFLRRAETIAESAETSDVVAEVRSRLAELALVKGDPGSCVGLANDALAISADIDSMEVGRCLRIRGEAELALGRFAAAVETLEEAVRVLEGTPDAIEQELAKVARARCWVRAGVQDRPDPARFGRAIMSLEQSALRFLELELPELAVGSLEGVARACDAAGSIDDAIGTVDRALELAEKHGISRVRASLLRLRTELEERCAATSLSHSSEHRLLEELAGFGAATGANSLAHYLRLAADRARSDRVLLAVRSRREGIRVEAEYGFGDRCRPSPALLVALFDHLDAGTRIAVIGDPRRDPRFALSGDLGSEIDAATVIPLASAGGEAFGLLYADRIHGQEDARYRVGDLRLLSFFAGIIGVFLQAREGERRAPRLAASEEPQDALSRFLTCDAEMRGALNLLRKLDRSDAGVLVTGETGTGKGLLSRLIHESGRRSGGPFVPINCAALPESLLESELFGHEQGAFTGALRTKRGLFEEAEGGTLFLDEVDKAPLGVQAKLLHVLDRHEIRPVGSTQWRAVDVRVVCATNVDLRQAIESGRFLEDLYYRLNDFQVHIPPLRERREDIPILVRHFLAQYRDGLGRQNVTFTREAIEALTDHDWRGNVRELEKVVKRVLVLAEDGEQIGVESLPREMGPGRTGRKSGTDTLRSAIERVEADLIGSCLLDAGGNKSEVARRLQVSYPCLLAKIKKYGLEPSAR